MLGLFQKRKKNQELRTPSLQDLKKFRDTYARYAELRQVETPPCFEKSVYKAIAGQKEFHTLEFRQEDITDPQIIALAEALLEIPIVSLLDLRDNRISDDGAKALLEVLRLQIIAAKTPPTIDPQTKQPLYPPLPGYTRYVTNVNLKGNEISTSVLQELSQYMDVLRREDKRLEIRTALKQIDRNSDGGIDEEEFKGVLKLITSSTPTKKEIRAFMQQHTLSTDSTQNAVNLENVILAKCAVSPSRHSASPPWESLVQERHAILGARRKASMMKSTSESPDPLSSKTHASRPYLSSAGNGTEPRNNPYSDVSPLSSPVSQIAPVAPIEGLNIATSPPPAPIASFAGHSTTKVTESKSSPTDQNISVHKPQIPILPLASVTQPTATFGSRSSRSNVDDDRNLAKHSVRDSPRSTRSIVDDEGQRKVSLTGPSFVISAPSSPHDSVISDNMSVVSSAFGGSISQRVLDDQDRNNRIDHKTQATVATKPVSTSLDSSRSSSDYFSIEDSEETSNTGIRVAREDIDKSITGDVDGNVRSVANHITKSTITPRSSTSEISDSKSGSGSSRRDFSISGHVTSGELLTNGSEYANGGHDEKRSVSGSAVSTPRLDDYPSQNYRNTEEGGRLANVASSGDRPIDQPEEDEEIKEYVDSLVFDVTKDGKERVVAKLIHHEFRSGLTVKDFPVDLSFRNLLALLLPGNGLSDLTLFTDCRFPFVTILDLSKNKFIKLSEDGLAVFPRLEVLNLADNQLKTITGMTKILKLRALSLSHNGIRAVKNIEHLEQMEMLQLAHNQIATVHALRLLSLNKLLAHLNLDGNPVVEMDERQKRKNIVHVRNLLPALQSLGSIPCSYIKDKKKTSTNTNPGKCLFDSEFMPEHKKLWVANACDTLHILQDTPTHNSSQSQHDDDEWDTRDEDSDDRPTKPLTREQQRLKDELRSRAIGFRSRGKAIPSPPKMKTSVFSSGPPQPPLLKKKKKKPTPADPSVVREQQRRSNELSAPKYTPVDKTLMQQQQRRKTRVDFNNAMTVGERIQLSHDLAQRRPTATLGLSARSRSILARADSRKRASAASTITVKEEEEGEPEENVKTRSRSPSPERPSPIKDAVVFRIDSADTPHSPKGVLSFRVDPYPAGLSEQPGTPKSNGSKEAVFLRDLAVTDFLNHAEEEFSTALTAMNVLLSMSEKEPGDRNKLAGYRASLDALDILNEHESHELFKKTQGHSEHELQAQCTKWFTKLGVVKKCMRQLLEKLEAHAPGSGVIRAYCRHLRSNELGGIITTMPQEENTTENIERDVENDTSIERGHESPQSIAIDTHDENRNSASSSVASRLFVDISHSHDSVHEHVHSHHDVFSTEDTDLDFLDSNVIALDEDKLDVDSDKPASQIIDGTSTSLGTENAMSTSDPALITDITMDIQMNNDSKEELAAIEDAIGNETLDEAVEAAQLNEGELHDQSSLEEAGVEATEMSALISTTQIEDYDWLATSTDLDAEPTDADTFEQDIATVSEVSDGVQEATLDQETTYASEDGEGIGEQAEADSFEQEIAAVSEDGEDVQEHCEADSFEQEIAEVSENEADNEEHADADEHYDWSNTETTESTIEEGVEDSGAVYDEGTYETEQTNEDIEENVDYSGDTEIATEERELTEAQHELGGCVDADDEEGETFGDWEKGFDPNSNHYFWFNHSTGESSWTPPDGWPHEIDEPFSAEDEDTGEGQQEQEYADETAEAQEYAEGEGYDENATEVQYYEEGAAEGQYYEEGAVEGQYYEEGASEDRYYEEGAAEGQYYEEGAVEGQYYEEGAVEGQEYGDTPYEEGAAEEQHYEEPTTDGQWYDETAVEDQNYEAVEGEEQAEEAGDESPRRSEVSDFEFDDSDLPGF